jgi:hypothetical protein
LLWRVVHDMRGSHPADLVPAAICPVIGELFAEKQQGRSLRRGSRTARRTTANHTLHGSHFAVAETTAFRHKARRPVS